MIANLEIDNSNKDRLEKILCTFKNRLFGGGLGKLYNRKPDQIKLSSYLEENIVRISSITEHTSDILESQAKCLTL